MEGLQKRCCRFGLLAVVFIMAAAGWLHAQARHSHPHDRCIVCYKTQAVGDPVWTFQVTNLVCEPCHLIKERCVECGVPVKDDFVKTTDGRFYCKLHRIGRIFDEYEAGRLYLDAVDELRRIARGEMELKHPETPVRLFDADYWNDDDGKKETNSLHKMGFSHSRSIGDRLSHGVVLLSGQPRQSLAAVCAHEYAHLWINENRAATNKIDPDIVEAVCELAAWKLMEFRNAPDEMEAIRVNTYTRGTIVDLLRLEKQTGFLEVLKWVRVGKDGRPPQLSAGTNDILAPRLPEAVTTPLWVAAPPALTTLELQGIIRRTSGGSAIINGVAIADGDEKTVPLGAGRISVRCVGITAQSVFVATNGSERIELRLGKRP